MKIKLVLLCVIFSKITLCQTIADVKKQLDEKDFSQFKQSVEKLKSDHCAPAEGITTREILKGYNEVVTSVVIFIPTPNGKYEGNCEDYQVNLVTKDNLIIKYSLYAKHHNDNYKKFELLKSYSNDTEVKAFQELYEKAFYRKLSMKELFDISITYGEHCGFAGISPEGRDILNKYVTTGNRNKLFYWLTSPSFERKLYAYEGFKALESKGYKLNQKESAIVNYLKNFKGTVRICNGCLYSNAEFSGMIDQLDGKGFGTVLKD
ncbi:hypothetical protein [Niastella sp. OAS944]|uniref:hypothetical protein n=1 Tax=Niastella sp. OAS944 TaxID=2664089 RepID=UPI0035C78F6F|nr:hypothetical protein [Chitinophagaceae bacterium OAS944]